MLSTASIVPFSETVSSLASNSSANTCTGIIVNIMITTSINETNLLKLKFFIVFSPFRIFYVLLIQYKFIYNI